MILEEGLNVKICSFPEGDDPDSFVRKNKKEKMLEFINNESKDFVDFKLSINKSFKDIGILLLRLNVSLKRYEQKFIF